MNYTAELKKFVTSQYINSGVRVALAIVVPSVILAHFGLLKEYFLFPLGTSFVGFADQPGPFVRRRNALILSALSFSFAALLASLLKDFLILKFLELFIFGILFTMIGVYGQRMAAMGSISLVIISIFLDGEFAGSHLGKNMLIFAAGCFWYILIFLTMVTIQPYKLAGQMIGENYLRLANFLKIKAQFYQESPDNTQLFNQLIAEQVKIKELQEETRDTVFRTRAFVKESTPASRTLLLLFLNSIDLHELLTTSENDYKKIQDKFKHSGILPQIQNYLSNLANELSRLGIGLQGNLQVQPLIDFDKELKKIYSLYFKYRNEHVNAENLEDFLILRQILERISEVTTEIKGIFLIDSQDAKLKKELSTTLDLNKFLAKDQNINFKVLRDNLSLKSTIFQHAIRVTVSLLIGYSIAQMNFLGVGHSYWILITILAILKPSFAITKSRNLMRLYGTIAGAVIAYITLHLIDNGIVLLIILFTSIMLCFSFLKEKYFWAVLFMTVYIFVTFNFLKPGNINIIFKDRIIDTVIALSISLSVSYFIFPVWEYKLNLGLMKKTLDANKVYFENCIETLVNGKVDLHQYKLARKDAMINLANLSANFQRMMSDPKKHQKRLELVHQFVSTSHLMTSYIASLGQYESQDESYPEIDFASWKNKILTEMEIGNAILERKPLSAEKNTEKVIPNDDVDLLLEQRKTELESHEDYDHEEVTEITRLTILKNIHEILELIFDVSKEQKKIAQNYMEELLKLKN